MKLTLAVVTLITVWLVTSCASVTGQKRVVAGALSGGAVGAGSGAILSPNEESRGMNALVFGLSGALIGGTIAILTDRPTPSATESSDLKTKERGGGSSSGEVLYPVLPFQKLPPYLKGRIQPLVIEEHIERDQIGEDGTLHEPHKAYRIKRNAELITQPIVEPSEGGKKQ